MLGVTRVNFNIESNGLVEIKIESGTMLQDLRIPQKLLKIITLGTLTNPSLVNQQYAKLGGKEVKNFEFFSTCLRDLVSK